MANDNSLLDIANNGAALNQAISELTTNVAKLSSITLPASNGGTGLTAPGANGNVLTSDGTSWISSPPASFAGVWTVPQGGTGRSSLTQYALLAGGTTATGNVQSLGTGTSGQVLTSSGSSAVPQFQTLTQSQLATAFNASGSAPFYACRAWVNFNGQGSIGANQTINANGNVTNVYKNGTGDYTITFTTAMPNANYAISGFGKYNSTNINEGAPVIGLRRSASNPTTSSLRVTSTVPSSNAAFDCEIVTVIVFC